LDNVAKFRNSKIWWFLSKIKSNSGSSRLGSHVKLVKLQVKL